jgi:hypothetical protein
VEEGTRQIQLEGCYEGSQGLQRALAEEEEKNLQQITEYGINFREKAHPGRLMQPTHWEAGTKRAELKITIPFHPVPRLMSGNYLPLPHTSVIEGA